MIFSALLILCHLFFTFKLGFIQKHVFKGIRYSFSSHSASDRGIGTYASFAAALGTTVGPGNITGVAVAIALGGPGAVLWMWVCGVLAMPTKYAEAYLSLKFAEKRGDSAVGGTMLLLYRSGFKRLSFVWAALCAVGGFLMGAAVPSRSLAAVMPFEPWCTGAVLAAITAAAVSFGLSGVSRFSSMLVPVMSVGFLMCCVAAAVIYGKETLNAASEILRGALSVKSVGVGAVAAAVKNGIVRGLYSNESGLGSGGVLAAESGDTNIGMSALGAMTTVFWDTVVMCAVTGTVLVAGGERKGAAAEHAVRSLFSVLPFGNFMLLASMSLFVLATVIGWYYIAKRATEYISSKTAWLDVCFTGSVFFGAVLPDGVLWSAADAVNFAMLLPSVFILLKMSGEIENINLYIRKK